LLFWTQIVALLRLLFGRFLQTIFRRFNFSKKSPLTIKSRPIGEKSPNLVTLLNLNVIKLCICQYFEASWKAGEEGQFVAKTAAMYVSVLYLHMNTYEHFNYLLYCVKSSFSPVRETMSIIIKLCKMVIVHITKLWNHFYLKLFKSLK
jgi:hypothetical protein